MKVRVLLNHCHNLRCMYFYYDDLTGYCASPPPLPHPLLPPPASLQPAGGDRCEAAVAKTTTGVQKREQKESIMRALSVSGGWKKKVIVCVCVFWKSRRPRFDAARGCDIVPREFRGEFILVWKGSVVCAAITCCSDSPAELLDKAAQRGSTTSSQHTAWLHEGYIY